MQHITLRDGRRLAFEWFGASPADGHSTGGARLELDTSGGGSGDGSAAEGGGEAGGPAAGSRAPAKPRTVLYFHGFPSSRLEAGLLHKDAVHHRLRLLAVDRPGAGGSTLNPSQVRSSLRLHSTQTACRIDGWLVFWGRGG